MREKYFDGKKIINKHFTNPWKNLSFLTGTDASQFSPKLDENSKPFVYLDKLCRDGPFDFRKKMNYLGLLVNRFT